MTNGAVSGFEKKNKYLANIIFEYRNMFYIPHILRWESDRFTISYLMLLCNICNTTEETDSVFHS